MIDSGTVSERGRRLLLRWALPIMLVLLLVVITWAAGGFAPASATSGPTGHLGEPVQLRRWVVTIHDQVQLTDRSPDGYEQKPAFRIRATVELTADTSISGFPYDGIQLRVPGGPPTGDRKSPDYSISEGFDPDLPREQVWDFPWTGRTVPRQVVITVLDEKLSDGYLFTGDWSTADPAAVITAPVVDRRERT